MDIATLRTFLAAAEVGSFSGAAERVHASPSSVTERIKQLEHRLGVKLFERGKQGCRLTRAGKRFLDPATQAVRALDLARHEVSLPDQFTRSLSFGAQFALWDRRLMDRLAALRDKMPDLAIRASAGASARLSRDLAEGFLDMAVLYDPVFRRDVAAEPLFEDRLVLVTGGKVADWRADYVRIEWGDGLRQEMASRLDLIPESGLVLDLGARSARWLMLQRMAGYMPLRVVRSMLDNDDLRLVEDAPQFDYPAYICWRRDLEPAFSSNLVAALREVR